MEILGDLNADGFLELGVGAPQAGILDQGEVHIIFGSAARFSGELEADVLIASDRTNDNFGLSLAGIGDINNDGFDDAAMGSAFNTVYVFYGTHDGIIGGGGFANEVADVIIEGAVGQRLGNAIEPAGDVNGDGIPDFLMSANRDDTGGNQAGAAVLVYGNRDLPGFFSTSDIESFGRLEDGTTYPTFSVSNNGGVEGAFIFSEEEGASFGTSLAGGTDFNGDGFDDIMIGGPGFNQDRGLAVLMYGGPYGTDFDPGVNGQGWNQALTVDGERDDWTDSITFDTTGTGAGAITWDTTNVYVGSNVGDVGTGGPSHFFVAYFGDGTGTGTTTGIGFNSQTPGLPFTANHAIAWRADDGFNGFYTWNGSSWDLQSNWLGSNGSAYAENGTDVVEFQIPLAELGNPSDLDVATYWLFEGAGFESSFDGIPSVAFNNGDFDPDFAVYYGFSLGTALGPANYGTLPTGGGAPALDGTWTTYVFDRDGDGHGDSTPTFFASCPMHAPITFEDPNDPKLQGIPADIALIDDCDDRNPLVFTGAPEVEGDNLDRDCDGFDGSNSPPTINVTLPPLFTNTVAEPGVDANDPEIGTIDETPLSFQYRWEVNGIDVGVNAPSLDGAVYFDKGDEVTVTVRVSDGTLTDEDSASRIVQNSPPVITLCKLLPQDPTIDESINAVTDFTDEDGDTVTFTFSWANGGVLDPEETAAVYPGTKTEAGVGIVATCTGTDTSNASVTSVSDPVFPAPGDVIADSGGDTGDTAGGFGCPADSREPDDSVAQATQVFGSIGNINGIPMEGGGPLDEQSYNGSTMCRNDPDYYSVPLDPLVSLTVTVDYTPANPRTPPLCIEVLDAQGELMVPCSPTAPGTTVVDTSDFFTSEFEDYRVRVYPIVNGGPAFPASGYDYDITFEIYPNFEGPEGPEGVVLEGLPQLCPDDRFEPNDDPITEATPVFTGLIEDLQFCDEEERDWFMVDLAAGETLDVTAEWDAIPMPQGFPIGADIDLSLVDSEGSILATSLFGPGTESVSYTASTNETVWIQVFLFDDGGSTIVDYSLDIAVTNGVTPPETPAACIEDDDAPGAGFLLTTPAPGTTEFYSGEDRTICDSFDADVFDVFLPAGSTVTGTVIFSHDEGDIDFWAHNVTSGVAFMANSVSTTDDELWTFVAPESGMYAFTALLFDDIGLFQEGNTYDWAIEITVPGGVGGDTGSDTGDTGDSGLGFVDTYDTDNGCVPYAHTLNVDGDDRDWRPTEQFATTSGGTTATLISWDDDYLYLGVRHPELQWGNEDNIAVFYIGSNQATGFDYGVVHGSQEPEFDGWTATHAIRFKADGTFESLQRARSFLIFEWWDVYPGYFATETDGSALAFNSNNQVMELRVPRDEVSFTDKLHIAAYWVRERPENEFSFGATPDNLFFEYDVDPDLSGYLEMDYCRPGGPRGAQVITAGGPE